MSKTVGSRKIKLPVIKFIEFDLLLLNKTKTIMKDPCKHEDKFVKKSFYRIIKKKNFLKDFSKIFKNPKNFPCFFIYPKKKFLLMNTRINLKNYYLILVPSHRKAISYNALFAVLTNHIPKISIKKN